MILPRPFRSGMLLLALGSLAPSGATAQEQRRATPNSNLKSTEVAADHRVTFRIYAPKASEVSVGGDFGQGGKMEKDDNGVWSLTAGPLVPDFYSYAFNVDGVRTVDPKNAMIKPGLGSVDSMFLVPGDEADFEMTKDVPHGDIRAVWYHSATLDSARRMHVYTPPGYDGGSEKYPVFYLLHGGGDEDSGWSTIGRAGFIVDNLIAAKKAVPMIVVMPNGSLPRPVNLPETAPGAATTPEARAARETAQGRFTDELLKDVIPTIEKAPLPREGLAFEPGARGTVDGRRSDASRVDHEPGSVRLRRDLERWAFRRKRGRVGTAQRDIPRRGGRRQCGHPSARDLRRRQGFPRGWVKSARRGVQEAGNQA